MAPREVPSDPGVKAPIFLVEAGGELLDSTQHVSEPYKSMAFAIAL